MQCLDIGPLTGTWWLLRMLLTYYEILKVFWLHDPSVCYCNAMSWYRAPDLMTLPGAIVIPCHDLGPLTSWLLNMLLQCHVMSWYRGPDLVQCAIAMLCHDLALFDLVVLYQVMILKCAYAMSWYRAPDLSSKFTIAVPRYGSPDLVTPKCTFAEPWYRTLDLVALKCSIAMPYHDMEAPDLMTLKCVLSIATPRSTVGLLTW